MKLKMIFFVSAVVCLGLTIWKATSPREKPVSVACTVLGKMPEYNNKHGNVSSYMLILEDQTTKNEFELSVTVPTYFKAEAGQTMYFELTNQERGLPYSCDRGIAAIFFILMLASVFAYFIWR